jgi:diamine N-acetyltransferase
VGIVGRAVELNRLYVQERFTGHGIGRQLLARAEREAARKGALVLWLTAWAQNERALRFYRSTGFREMGTSQYSYGDESYETRVFIKNLPTP